jgi:hypothetical protein
VFPPEDDGLWYLLSRYFVPEENLRKRAERDRVPYDQWTRQGFIEATPGNVVDYGAIEQRILADSALFQVKEIAYDPWNATHIALRLQDEGATMVEFRQGFRSMAAPTRELEKLIVSRKLAHGGNPVTRWMAANVARVALVAKHFLPLLARDRKSVFAALGEGGQHFEQSAGRLACLPGFKGGPEHVAPDVRDRAGVAQSKSGLRRASSGHGRLTSLGALPGECARRQAVHAGLCRLAPARCARSPYARGQRQGVRMGWRDNTTVRRTLPVHPRRGAFNLSVVRS